MPPAAGDRRTLRRICLSLVALACSTVLVGGILTGALTDPSDPRTTAAGVADALASPGARTEAVSRTAARRDDDRPNLLVITLDDMREDDLQWMPKTQRLLGRQGARFENAFAPYPLCCPSRSSFLTGKYTHNHHVWSHVAPWGFASLDDSETLPVWLQRAGYRTSFLGKYLNGYGRQPAPDGSSEHSTAYVPPGWDDWQASLDGGLPPGDPLNGGTYRYFDTSFNHNGSIEAHPGRYSTRLLGDLTAAALAEEAAQPEPFFMWVNYVAPHHGGPRESDDPGQVRRSNGRTTSFVTPARPNDVKGRFDWRIKRAPGASGEADVSDKPYFIRQLVPLNKAEKRALRSVARQRAEALAVADHQVKRTVQALRSTGQLKNTVIMFTSDNGYFLGEHRIRQGKVLPYEPSLAVPLLVRGPGVPAGVVRKDPFITADFAPTLLEAAGVPSEEPFDGVSAWGVLTSGDRGWSRGVLTDSGPRGSVTTLGENLLPVPGVTQGATRFSVGLRTARWLYVEHANGERELYDMRHDPGQLDSVAGRPWYARTQAVLSAELQRLRDCRAAACSAPMPAALRRAAR